MDRKLCLKYWNVQRHRKNWNSLEKTLETYGSVADRNIYLFDWLLFMWEKLSFSSVEKKYLDSLAITKTKIAVIDTLIDDIADVAENPKVTVNMDLFFRELMKFAFRESEIKWGNLNDFEKKYLYAVLAIWKDILQEIEKYPRYDEFRRVFEFDVEQIINSMWFSRLVTTKKYFNNSVENNAYGHHGMTVIACGVLDLMCSPKFDIQELGFVRGVLYKSQQLARIGNMYNTYSREIKQRDFTSEILTLAVEKKIINPDQIDTITEDQKQRICDLYAHYFETYWNSLYEEIKLLGRNINSIDMNIFLKERKFIQKKYEERVSYWDGKYKKVLFIN